MEMNSNLGGSDDNSYVPRQIADATDADLPMHPPVKAGMNDRAKKNPKSSKTQAPTIKDKKGRSTSCYLCQKRKQKCDQRFPSCTNCIRAHVKCVQPPRYGENYRSHVKDDYTALLEKKVKQLESLLDETTKKIYQLEQQDNRITSSSGITSSSVRQIDTHENNHRVDTINANVKNVASLPSAVLDRSETSTPFDSSRILKYRKIGDLLDISKNTARSYLPYDQFDHALNKPYTYFMADNADRVKKSSVASYHLTNFLRYDPVFDLDQELSRQLIDIYFAMLQYKFPLLSEQEVKQFHHDYFERKVFSNHVDYHFRAARMLLIFAISAILYRATGRYRGPAPYRFFSSALRHIVFCQNLEPLKKIELLVLLCLLINRTDKDSNCLYMIITDAMKLCMRLSLHKQKSYCNVSSTLRERHLRCFWCAYILERSVSIAVAKPFTLKESKIDKSLPSFDSESSKPTPHSTIGTKFINQVIKIRRMEAHFVEDLNILSSASIATRTQLPKVQIYFQRLQEWRKECQGFQSDKETETLSVYYYRAVRNLIQPFLELLDPDDKLFKECQAAAGQICQAIKTFHQKTVSGHSILNIHTTFTSGVTLIYCLWLERNRDDMKRKLLGDDKKHTRPLVSAALFSGIDDLRACSISLYVMAERTKFALSFRDSFDELMHATVDNLILRCGPNSSEILNYSEPGMPPAVYRQPLQHYQLDSRFTQKTAAETQEDEERTKRTGHLTRLAIPRGLSHLLIHSPTISGVRYGQIGNSLSSAQPTTSTFAPPTKPLIQSSAFGQSNNTFSVSNFHAPPPSVRSMNFGSSATMPNVSIPPVMASPIANTASSFSSMSADTLRHANSGNENTVEELAHSQKTLNGAHANNSDAVYAMSSSVTDVEHTPSTPTTTASSSSSITPVIANTPIIPELLPFVGRTTAMINNISVWTGESGQQIPQTGLVMIQQQNNANSNGNPGFLMNSSGNTDGYTGMPFRAPSQTGADSSIFGNQVGVGMNFIGGNSGTNGGNGGNGGNGASGQSGVEGAVSGNGNEQVIDSSSGNGMELLNNWGSYPNDDFWSVRNDLGFIP
ncbi:hypothetical protein FOA43_000485 [Brettanomyces nanus]|uniref:Zn(2)-C6 fungal-type domain-containing protein n=1 Tax=Eeniella nana TaxID=13502 RepID=A0A875RZV2_EENNA|nr:uncharacterized protein FOA43_000485 [Brettanomyces nanus]QPG73179.1 hypothetical protein FOA43_000485 [Brettanomyces nanus]